MFAYEQKLNDFLWRRLPDEGQGSHSKGKFSSEQLLAGNPVQSDRTTPRYARQGTFGIALDEIAVIREIHVTQGPLSEV